MSPDLSTALTPCPRCRRDIPLRLAECLACGSPADTASPFLRIRYRAGGAGMVDQPTAAFLRSDLPEPSQAALDQLLERTTSVTLKERFPQPAGPPRSVIQLTSPDDLASLRSALRISPPTGAHRMAAESHELLFHSGDHPPATIHLVRAFVLRWRARWKSDASLADPDALADFFASRGCPAFRDELDERRAEAVRHARDHEAWQKTWDAATPEGLAAWVPDLADQRYAPTSPARDQALAVLAKTHPSPGARILARFGHSLGPWSGYPSEESVPELLLETFPHEQVVAAARRPDLTPNQLEGAARFFCRWIHQPGRKKKPTRPPIPAPVRDRLWAYVQSTGDRDKIERAKRILRANGLE